MKRYFQMKNIAIKTISSDRITFIMVMAVILLAILTLTSFIYANRIERKNKVLKTQLNELGSLRDDVLKIKDIVESQERKIGLIKVSGAVSGLEQTLDSMGLKAKVIKPIGGKKMERFIEEDAELTIEGVDLNKIINLLYRIEHSPLPIKIKHADIKTSFENPSMFILSITASLISTVEQKKVGQ